MNAISTVQGASIADPKPIAAQKTSPRPNNKVVIDPKTWKSISISAAKCRRQQHDGIPNGTESDDRDPTWTRQALILSPTLDSTETNPISIDRWNDSEITQEEQAAVPPNDSICLDGQDRQSVSESISIIEPDQRLKIIDRDEEDEEDRILLPVDRRLLLPSSSQPEEESNLIRRSIAHPYSLSAPSSRSSTTATTTTPTVSSCSSSSSLH